MRPEADRQRGQLRTRAVDAWINLVWRSAITEVDELLYEGPNEVGTGNDLSLSVKVACKPKGGLSKQKMEEIRSALRELGLDDRLDV